MEVENLTEQEQIAAHQKWAAKMNADRERSLKQESKQAREYLKDVDLSAYHELMKGNIEDAKIIEQATERIKQRGEAPVVQLYNHVNEIIAAKRTYNEYLSILEELRKDVGPVLDEFLDLAERIHLPVQLPTCDLVKANFAVHHANWHERFVEMRTYGPMPGCITHISR